MPFMIETFDKANHYDLRLALRDEHLVYLDEHMHLLIACGAKLNDAGDHASGGVYLVALEEREDAREFIENDPFYKGELFERVEIVRWRQAYLDGKNTL